jgi:hypothetical protein
MNVREVSSFLAIVLGLFCSLSEVAWAAPVHYDETVNGDLPKMGTLPTLQFEIGTNTVSGRFGLGPTYPVDPGDFDSFAFTIPVGSQLVAGQVSLVDVVGEVHSSLWRFRKGSAEFQVGAELELLEPDSPGEDSLTTIPLGPGLYNLSHHTLSYMDPSPAEAQFTFTFELVPEPTSAALLLLVGMSTLSFWRRRI